MITAARNRAAVNKLSELVDANNEAQEEKEETEPA
jgi:hypothetical protein